MERPDFIPADGLVRDAFDYAARMHDGQERKGDGSPYIHHPTELARLLREAGGDDELIAAALLHDTVEDTDATLEEIRERFGDGVFSVVKAMTEDASVEPWERRKDDHRDMIERAGERAARVYVADKLANLRDLRTLYANVGEGAASRFNAPVDTRFRLWRDDVAMAERVIPEFELTRDLRAELAAFEAERAAAT